MSKSCGAVASMNTGIDQAGGCRSRSPETVAAPFPTWPSFTEDEIEAVVAVLRSGRVNRWTGEENLQFEKEFAAFTGNEFAIALANGTVALELALYALGVGPGDEVIVPSRTFIASASAAVLRGATPVFADVDPVSQNLTAETIEPLVSPRTKAVMAVHMAGWPCEMDDIQELARRHGFKVVEDCAQAHGATYRGRPVGSLGDVAAFSFCQDKIMTTGGEGGMLVTSDPQIWHRAWAYKDHGKNYLAVTQPHDQTGFRWLHDTFGTNWRMTEMQAALGRLALRKLPHWLGIRRRYAGHLTASFQDLPVLRVTPPPRHIGHAYYKYYVFVEPEHLAPEGRDDILAAVNAAGVPCFSGACSEIYLEAAFQVAGLGPRCRLPIARRLGETSLLFLVHPTLTDEHLFQTSAVVAQVVTGLAANSGNKE